MNDILQSIVETMRPQLAAAKAALPEAVLREELAHFPSPRDFAAALRGDGLFVIAELKKASPSRGVIREDFPVRELAMELQDAGAAAFSVLTERNYFRGGLENLAAVRPLSRIPVLRKDFIFDPYQLLEARYHGADAVLLIAALLDQSALLRLATQAHELGLTVLGEAHDAEEVRRLLDSPVDLIGVNARNLSTFATDLERSLELIAALPPERLPVAESALTSHADLLRFRAAGAAGFLIGETLMRAPHPGEKLRELLGK